MYTSCSNSHPVHERVLQFGHFPFACSEVQVDAKCHLLLSDLLVGGRDRIQILAVEPADQKLENFGVLRGKIEGKRDGKIVDSLAEPFVLDQKGFVNAVAFSFWPNIDLDHVANQVAFHTLLAEIGNGKRRVTVP